MLDTVRTPNKNVTAQRKLLFSVLILVFGILMGLGSKMLDETGFNELPWIMQRLDITNFLGRFAVWIFIAVCISVYSSSPGRASLNVFLFFLGMTGSYYLYSALVAGLFPVRYALIWFGITVVSPLPAFVCWYASGRGWPAVVISGVIVGVLFSQAVFLFQGIRLAHVTELIVWLASLAVLRRRPKEFAAVLGISLVTAALVQLLLPYWG